jgi:hypothetical protein
LIKGLGLRFESSDQFCEENTISKTGESSIRNCAYNIFRLGLLKEKPIKTKLHSMEIKVVLGQMYHSLS